VAAGLLVPAAARAGQGGSSSPPDARTWELAVHVGGILSTNPTDGTASLPPPGPIFNTLSQIPSRRVPSWFFGDGALLLNQVSAALNLPTRIAPLDAALTSPGTQRRPGASAGFRLGRPLTNRLGVEFSFDYSRGALALTSATREAFDQTRQSFESAFQTLFATRPDIFRQPMTDTAFEITETRGSQAFTTAAVNLRLRTRGSVIPYVTAGAGGAFNSGGADVVLFGTYGFRVPSGAIADTDFDAVRVKYSVADRQFVGVVGGGVAGDITPAWGWRVDARTYLGRSRARVVVDTQENTGFQPVGVAVTIATNPALQFSSLRDAPASLGGPPLDDVATFTGRGAQTQTSLTAGVFVRLSPARPGAGQPVRTRWLSGGVTAGLLSTTLSVTGDDPEPGLESRLGVAGGGYLTIGDGAAVSFQPEFLITTRGATLAAEGASAAVGLTYFETPLLLRLRVAGAPGAGVFALVGPTFSARLSARTTYEGEIEDISDETRAGDAAFLVGAGLSFARFDLGVRYTWGLLNVADDEDVRIRNRAFSVMIGLPLR
jgi:hypothetical protein